MLNNDCVFFKIFHIIIVLVLALHRRRSHIELTTNQHRIW